MSLIKPRSKKSPRPASPPRASANPALDLFHRHWHAIEKQQAKMDKFASDGRAIYDRFCHELEPLERQQCALIYQLCQRLTTFTARKSFTQWQRETLHDWIHELFSYLESNPFRGELDLEAIAIDLQANSSALMDEEMIEQQCDFMYAMLMEACGHAPDDREQLRAFVRDPHLLRDYMLNARAQAQSPDQDDGDAGEEGDDVSFDWDLEGVDEDEDNPFADHAFDDDEPDHAASQVDALFDKSSLKQLYRKLAMALHPDREPDPVKREEKNQLMGQLSHAWEHQEMFTLLQLAHTHLPESESLLSADNLAYINPLLKQRLRELERQYYLETEQGLLAVVLRRFKQRSKKKTEAAFAEHRAYLEQDIGSLKQDLAEIRSLQTLKPYLSARLNVQQEAFWEDDFDLDSLFR